MHQQISAILTQFAFAQERLHRVAARTPEERWAERADPPRWSVAECVAHLNLTGAAYLPLLGRGLEEARALGTPTPARYRRSVAGWLISSLVGPMPRIGGWRFGRAKTPASFVPEGALPREQVLAEFDRLQEEQMRIAREADGLPIHLVRITSPFVARMRYDLYSSLLLLPRHQMRHIEQAEEVWAERG